MMIANSQQTKNPLGIHLGVVGSMLGFFSAFYILPSDIIKYRGDKKNRSIRIVVIFSVFFSSYHVFFFQPKYLSFELPGNVSSQKHNFILIDKFDSYSFLSYI